MCSSDLPHPMVSGLVNRTAWRSGSIARIQASSRRQKRPVSCGNCQAEVAELPVPKKKPGRVKIPVRPHALVEEYGFSSRSVKLEHNDAEYSDHEHSDDDGGLDFDAAGGAA